MTDQERDKETGQGGSRPGQSAPGAGQGQGGSQGQGGYQQPGGGSQDPQYPEGSKEPRRGGSGSDKEETE
jgi:hypothetical protein